MDNQDVKMAYNNSMAFVDELVDTVLTIKERYKLDEQTALGICKLSYQVANNQKMKEVTNMTNDNQTTAPMTLTELKAWVEETCEPLERTVLRMFYVNRLEIWDIEDKVGRTKTTIYRLRKKGIESIAKIMSEENLCK